MGSSGGAGRVVDHHQHPLSFHIDTGVVVPFLLWCHDAMANEHDIALEVDTRLLRSPKCHDIVVVPIRVARHTQRERSLDDRLDDWHLLQVRAVVTRRLETRGGQLRREILRGESPAACRWSATLHEVVRQHANVSLQGGFPDLVLCWTSRGCCGSRAGSRLLSARAQRRKTKDDNRSTHVDQITTGVI